jgi:hypothetical protein
VAVLRSSAAPKNFGSVPMAKTDMKVVEKNWESDGYFYTIFKEGILYSVAPHVGQPEEARTIESIKKAHRSFLDIKVRNLRVAPEKF